jgi:hypothetical protein
MLLNYRKEFIRCNQGPHQHIFSGFRESAYGPPAPWLGAPLQAAAGRAMAVKLQINREYKSWATKSIGIFTNLMDT